MQRPLSAHFDNIAAQIRQELRKANYSIKLAIAWLTEQSLLGALADAARRGVQVEVVVSRSEYNKIYDLAALTEAGAEVIFHGAETVGGSGFIHHKFCVIDYRTLITGSFNWSKNADTRNEENIVISRDDESVAAEYLTEFQTLFLEGTPLAEERGERDAEASFFDRIFRRPATAAPPRVRFWATHAIGTPGDPVDVLWQVPADYRVSLSLAGDLLAEELPAQGRLAVTMPDEAADLTLTAYPPAPTEVPEAAEPNEASFDFGDDAPVPPPIPQTATPTAPTLTRSLRLRPATAPSIDLFTSDHPTIIEGALVTTLRWRVRHADVVEITPLAGPSSRNLSGEAAVSPRSTTLYTLTARGRGGTRDAYVTVGVFPMPVLKSLTVPVPNGIRIDLALAYAQTPVPSGLDLSATRLAHRAPRIEKLRAELVPNRPTIGDVATAHGYPSAGHLTVPPLPPAPRSWWGQLRQDILIDLERRFADNWRAAHLLSTFRCLYDRPNTKATPPDSSTL